MHGLLRRFQSDRQSVSTSMSLRNIGLATLCALAALFSGCTKVAQKDASLSEYANQFVPADATQRMTAPGIPWEQVSYDVLREPLEFAIAEPRLRQATADGWKLCEPATSEWTGYTDMSVTPARYTQARTYVLYRDGVQIMLMGMYYSASEAASVKKHDGQADKPVQHGVVIARRASEKEALETAAQQNLHCGGR